MILRIVVLVFMLTSGLPVFGQDAPANQDTRPDPQLVNAPPYRPITAHQRFNWFVDRTVGPATLTAGVFTAGIGTARNSPREYGTHWEGFGKRYGMRLTGVSTGNAMEATIGAIWGEDPRYRDRPQFGEPFKMRVRHVVVMTFLARNREGNLMPAYARYIATPGNNFLSNTWRADSEANNRSAALRTVWGFLGLMGRNAFDEFWPDAQRKFFHGKAPNFPGTAPDQR